MKRHMLEGLDFVHLRGHIEEDYGEYGQSHGLI